MSLLLTVSCLASCGGRRPELEIDKVPVVPVKGTVTVDGNPTAGVIVRSVPLGVFEPKGLSNALGGRTNDKGEFSLGTYAIDDGVPPGEYALLFVWPAAVVKKQSRADEEKTDRLKGKYSKVGKALLKIKVETEQPQVLDPIELKTK